jgi:saccharopepsin
MTYGPVFAYGKDSIDTLTLVPGLEVAGQHFHELIYYEQVYPDTGTELFDAALGLAWEMNPSFENPQARSSLMSPFRSLVEAAVLDENMFSILLPSKEAEGDIMFGGYDSELFNGDLVQHSLFPANTTDWQIEVQSVRMGDEILGTGGYTGLIQTQMPLIILPAVIGDPITRHFNQIWTPCARVETIPCSQVANLPALGIMLNGQEIQLRGEDYVERMWFEDCEEKWQCIPLIEAVPNYVPPEQFPRDWIILGSAFLKKVYAVYNWDRKTVGCEYPWFRMLGMIY